MLWVAQWPALVAAVAVFFLPGLLVLAGLRMRGLALWALAPVVSTFLLAVLAIVLDLFGIRWSPAPVGVGVALVIAAAWAGGAALGPRASQTVNARLRWMLVAGLVFGAILGALRFCFYVGDPEAISQTNDAVFHLNALRWILENGSASSLDVSRVIGSRSFYPGAWHAMTSMTAMLAGTDVFVAANMVALVIVALIWPLGIAWFTRVTTKGATETVFAAALSSSLLVFPILLFEWGVLYPNALALAMVPAAAAVAIGAPRLIRGEGWLTSTPAAVVVTVLLLGAGVGAIALAQPANLIGWMILVAVWLTWWAGRRIRAADRRGRVTLSLVIAGTWIVFAGCFVFLTRGTSGSHWPPFRGKREAAVDVLLNGHVDLPYALGVSLLMLVGLVVCVRVSRMRWLATAWLILSVLYVLCAAAGNPWVRQWILGAWYADPYRLASMTAVVVVPLAAIGLTALVRMLAGVLPMRRGAAAAAASSLALAVVAVLGAIALAVSPVVPLPRVVEGGGIEPFTRYASSDESFLSPDERTLLARLAETVEADATILGNPSTGTGYAYAMSGRNGYPRTWASPRTEEWAVLSRHLREGSASADVCAAIDAFSEPLYVLDFGEGEAAPGRYIMPGMTGFEGQDGFELVDSEGDATLWLVTACDM